MQPVTRLIELPPVPPMQPLRPGATDLEKWLAVQRKAAHGYADAALRRDDGEGACFYRGRANAFDDALRVIAEATNG